MLEKSLGLFAFLKQPKNQNTKERYVYLRITVDGQSKEVSTKRLWTVDRWHSGSGRAIGTKEDARSLNAALDSLCTSVHNARMKISETGKQVTAEKLKNMLIGKGSESKMLLQCFKEHNAQMEALVGKDFVKSTLRRYKTTYNYVHEFLNWKYAEEDIDIQDLDFEFVSDLSFWLKSIKNCNHNTVMKYITNIKKVILICIRKGWLNRDPFMHFKTTRKEVLRVALTENELEFIITKRIDLERLSLVRDIFVFSCYTGLAYIDVSNLRREQIVKGVDGEQWIITTRQKTGSPSRLPLLKIPQQIVEKYRDHPKCKDQGFVLPVLSNQKTNSYLKEIADICGVNKNLTFHIARHTFATTITLSHGVPMETVSKMLGHSNIKQTQHYAKILDTKISRDMMDLRKKIER